MLALEVAILSERGGRAYNEDACGHWHSDRTLCCVLADGAGGHGGGELAARLAVSRVIEHIAEAPTTSGPELNALLREVNQGVIDARVPGTPSAQMHSTVVCVVLDFADPLVHWAHAGDSRLYWFRDGRVLQQTRDHSMVQSLVDAGMLPPDQLRSHPKRSELRSALGTEAHELQVSDSGAAQRVQPGDVFLLCTDGLWEHVEEAQMEALLQAAHTPNDWLAALEQAVLARTAGLRSHDNFTALAVWSRQPI
jgi:serine/threonine protein phosphatase PrpC